MLQIELIETVLSGANELVESDKVDLAISPLPLKEGFSEQLCQMEFIAVANPEHALHALNRDITEQDLKSYRQVVVRDSALENRSDSGWLGANQRWTVSHLRTSVRSDLAISPLPLKEGFSEQLCQMEFIAVANPEHALHALNRDITEQDLKSYRQVVVRDSALENRSDSGWLGANQRWTVSHLRTSVDMICDGIGYAWLPLSSIQDKLDSGELKPLPLASNSIRSMQLYLVFLDGDNLGPAAKAFLGELRYQCD